MTIELATKSFEVLRANGEIADQVFIWLGFGNHLQRCDIHAFVGDAKAYCTPDAVQHASLVAVCQHDKRLLEQYPTEAVSQEDELLCPGGCPSIGPEFLDQPAS